MKKFVPILCIIIGLAIGGIVTISVTAGKSDTQVENNQTSQSEATETVKKDSTDEIPDEILSLMKHFKTQLKDPSSMQLYGDVYASIGSVSGSDKGNITVSIDFNYNAKNSIGGYAGVTRMCHQHFSDGDLYTLKEEGQNLFSDVHQKYDYTKAASEKNSSDAEMVGDGIYKRYTGANNSYVITYRRIDGKTFAEKIGCEFVEYDW